MKPYKKIMNKLHPDVSIAIVIATIMAAVIFLRIEDDMGQITFINVYVVRESWVFKLLK
ncbi:MAG: hypothetical protein O2963_03035 [Proteobacteria bacterium]|nr:hypothetical protein [Pseudomonadota bacterium]